MGATPTYALPYPELDDPDNVPADTRELAEAVEAAIGTAIADAVAQALAGAGGGGGAIPGEVTLWPGGALPTLADYGRWAWCDGAAYDVVTYPLAAANISPAWKVAHGAADPGAGKFRVPDLRGVAPFGMDGMPGGARVNRVARAAAGQLAGTGGAELHALTVAELAAHAHPVNDPTHIHGGVLQAGQNPALSGDPALGPGGVTDPAATGITIGNTGGGAAHENLPPAVFVPYIVKLDD